MRSLFVLILGIFFSNQPTFATEVFVCPQAIQLYVEIGEITVADPDYTVLSGARFDGVYELNSTLDTCLYVEKKAGVTDEARSKRYAEIKHDPRRGLIFNFETYTAKSKVVGVTTKLDDDNYEGDYQGFVSERSGVHKKLGEATVMIRSAN